MALSGETRRALYLLAAPLGVLVTLVCAGCGGTSNPIEYHSISERASSDNTNTVFAAFAGTGQLFVYRIANSGGSSTLLTQVSNDGNPNNDGGTHPFFSPDGSKVVFVSDDDGNQDIFTMGRDGGSRTQLTTDPGSDRQPSFTPDGTQIVFASNRTGNYDIWIMDDDGANQRQLTNSSDDEEWPSVGPVSKLAWQLDDNAAGDTDIYTADIPGAGLAINVTNVTPAGTFNEGAPSWDPTGTGAVTDTILFHSDEAGTYDIWKMDADGSNHAQLVTTPASEGFPVWFPNGQRFVFTMAREAWHAASDGTDKKRITTRFPS